MSLEYPSKHRLLTDQLDIWASAVLPAKTGSRGRAASSSKSPHGIQKLRELILELAVRGKLVPQNPSDEPAIELLKRIVAEKKRLLKEGKINSLKALPEIGSDEISFELPEGWEWVRFGEIAQHNSGKTLDGGRNSGELREYITTSNLYWGRFELESIRQMPIRDEELEKCSAKKGDLLICEGGEAGRAAVWPFDKSICFQNHVHRARLYGGIDPYFVYRFFEKLNATGGINNYRKGVGISNMSSKALASVIITLPPLAEQHRIVAKVDELMALCDRLEQEQTDNSNAHQTLVETLLATLTISPVRPEPVEGRASTIHPSTGSGRTEFAEAWTRIAEHFDTLFTTEQSIDQLKQTILQLAVMGKLVPQDPNDGPASELLKKIAVEKYRLVKEKKIKKQQPLPEIGDDEMPFILPSGWVWSRLQDSIDVRDGTHDSPKDAVGENVYPLVTSKNFASGEIDFDGARKISAEDHFEISKRSLVEKYDILFSMIGGNLGNQVMVNSEREFSVKNVALFKYYNTSLTSPFFIKVFMEHLALDLQHRASGGAQPFVSLGFLRSLPFALPPQKEQHRIVAKVDELMAVCDALKARLSEAQITQVQLADAIVEQAVG